MRRTLFPRSADRKTIYGAAAMTRRKRQVTEMRSRDFARIDIP
jgi:hypothetical protein